MTLSEALDIVAPPGRGRYRQLCDPGHPDYDPRYIPIVMAKATGQPLYPIAAHSGYQGTPTDRPNVAESAALLAATKTCPYRSIDPGCGCSGARCGLRRSGIVSHTDCFACVKRFG